MRGRWLLVSAVCGIAFAPRVFAGERTPTALPSGYVEECGACHVAYPGRMLGAGSWSALLDGLDRHFGVDASVDPATLERLRQELASTARRKETTQNGKPVLRITEARWFRHEHEEIPARLKSGPQAVALPDCAACHREAERGSYAERSLHLPPKGGQK